MTRGSKRRMRRRRRRTRKIRRKRRKWRRIRSREGWGKEKVEEGKRRRR